MNDPNAQAAVQAHFEHKRFVYLQSFLSEPLLTTAYRYALLKTETGEMTVRDSMVPGTPSMYSDTLMETLLGMAHPMVEAATGLRLFPTYSYFRVYKHGDVLVRHTDRPSCEISVTLTLGFEADRPWSMWFREGELQTSVEMEPGDAIVYRGIEVHHWRNAFEGTRHAQVFLHYVDQNGPYAEWRFDKRPMLGLPLNAKNQLT